MSMYLADIVSLFYFSLKLFYLKLLALLNKAISANDIY